MGTVSFSLPVGLSPAKMPELERACVAGGPDNMPWPTQVQLDPRSLTVRRAVDESGFLVVPWDVEGHGRLMGTSATLMERPTPYNLQIELARGKINQLRCQAADWRAGGLQIPNTLTQLIRDVSLAFGHVVVQEPSEGTTREAQQVLVRGYDTAEQLVRLYVEQVFQIRQQRQPLLDSQLGCRLDTAPATQAAGDALSKACNSVSLALAWKDVEPSEGTYLWDAQDQLVDWAASRGLAVSAGPLVDFSSARLPDWLWLFERDLQSLARFMCSFVESAVRRYHRRIRRWQLTASANCANVLSLGEEELLWLTVRLAEAARQVDPTLEIVTGISQPWGEYMASEDRSYSPFIFADTLIRAGLNLAALEVELFMGVTPRGSYCRDLLETSRLLDLYSMLGVPLRVTLGYPSAPTSDPSADPDLQVGAGHWREGFTPEAQGEWVAAYGALALCKPYVQGVSWCHLSDAQPHQIPHAGLLDAKGEPKPALQHLTDLRVKRVR